MVEITKVIEWDMGHRVPNHQNKCRNLHGHRYRLEVTVAGELRSESGASDEGMVLDFGDLKQLLRDYIEAPLDHVCMYYQGDEVLGRVFEGHGTELAGFKVEFIPTAENIALWCFDQLKSKLPPHLHLSSCKLYETPNSWAEIKG